MLPISFIARILNRIANSAHGYAGDLRFAAAEARRDDSTLSASNRSRNKHPPKPSSVGPCGYRSEYSYTCWQLGFDPLSFRVYSNAKPNFPASRPSQPARLNSAGPLNIPFARESLRSSNRDRTTTSSAWPWLIASAITAKRAARTPAQFPSATALFSIHFKSIRNSFVANIFNALCFQSDADTFRAALHYHSLTNWVPGVYIPSFHPIYFQ